MPGPLRERAGRDSLDPRVRHGRAEARVLAAKRRYGRRLSGRLRPYFVNVFSKARSVFSKARSALWAASSAARAAALASSDAVFAAAA